MVITIGWSFVEMLREGESFCSTYYCHANTKQLFGVSMTVTIMTINDNNDVDPVTMVVVVVAFSSRARILGECSTIYSPPALPPPLSGD